MVSLLLVQQPERLGQTIRISARAAAATGARAGLAEGQRYLASDLLSAMLVRSANDACLALAEHVGGSVEEFVAGMNRAARLLELEETRFENPCGWDAPGQHSSARDVMTLARLAMDYPQIRERVALREFALHRADGPLQKRLRNTNLLLGDLPGTVGVKTGFTARAGKCLVALVEREGTQVWLVLLGAEERWWTAHRALESAFRDEP